MQGGMLKFCVKLWRVLVRALPLHNLHSFIFWICWSPRLLYLFFISQWASLTLLDQACRYIIFSECIIWKNSAVQFQGGVCSSPLPLGFMHSDSFVFFVEYWVTEKLRGGCNCQESLGLVNMGEGIIQVIWCTPLYAVRAETRFGVLHSPDSAPVFDHLHYHFFPVKFIAW